MAKLPPLVMRDFSGGIQTSANSGLVGPSALRYTVNMYNDSPRSKVGSLTSRYGFNNNFGYVDIDIAAMAPTEEIVGLCTWLDPNAAVAKDLLVAAITNGLAGDILPYYYDGADWILLGTLAGWDAGFPVRFEVFANYLIGVNGRKAKSLADSSSAWGTTYVNGVTGIIAALALRLDLIKAFQGRLYLASDFDAQPPKNGYTVYFSPPDLTSAWSITNSFQITGGSDAHLTALEVNGNLLLIFKSDGIYTWDGYQTQSAPLYTVGAVNQEVVKTIDGKTLFLGQQEDFLSVYMYNGSYPVDISEPVRDFLKIENLVDNTNIPANFSAWKNDKEYCLNISDVTIDGQLFTGVVLIYNTDSGKWTVFSISKKSGTYNNYFRFSTEYYLKTTTSTVYSYIYANYKKRHVVLGGKSLGSIDTQDVGLSPVIWSPSTTKGDNIGGASNNPIDILIQTHELEFGSRSLLKTIQKFNVFASGNYGCVVLQVRVDGGAWQNVEGGALTNKTTTFAPAIQGYYFEFRLIGQNSGEPFVFEGFDFFDVDSEGYQT